MYAVLYEAHRGLSMLAFLATVLWALVALVPALRHRPAPGLWRPLYIAAMATTGLSGVTGFVVLLMGDWLTFVFPWLGLVAVALHGFAGVRGRKALAAGATALLAVALIVQVATLAVIYGLMTVKPF